MGLQGHVDHPAPATAGTRPRLAELEGLRALAVIAVMLFHFFARFGADYPYGPDLVPGASYGWLGVQLFFVISGFVIALTLHNTRSPFDFAVRRAARLVPAMIVCSALTFLVLWTIDTPFTRAWRVGPEGFLPSLSFTDPMLWHWLFPKADYVDGAYWSLFVEVRFYFWAALGWFVLGRRMFLPAFLGAALLALLACALLRDTALGTPLELLFFPHYLALFCTGMIAHALHGGARGAILLVAFALFAGLSIWSVQADGAIAMALVAAILVPFVLLIWRPLWLAPLGHPALTLIGATSYSLYLIHQNVGMALIGLLPRGQAPAFYLACVLVLALTLLAFARLIFRTVEQPAQRLARRWLARSSAQPRSGSNRLASP